MTEMPLPYLQPTLKLGPMFAQLRLHPPEFPPLSGQVGYRLSKTLWSYTGVVFAGPAEFQLSWSKR